MERSLGGAVVEVCSACAGLWLDASDGDPAALSRAAQERWAPKRPDQEPASAPEPRCPRCDRDLGIAFVAGAGLLRCAGCRGLFLDRFALGILAARAPATSPRLGGAVGWLRALVFGADTQGAGPRGRGGAKPRS